MSERRVLSSWFGASALVGALLAAGCSNEAGPAIAVNPATLYTQMCARCHGEDGKGDPQLKLTMPVRDFTNPEFRQRATVDSIEMVIMTGRNQMPAFGSNLSAPKIQAIAGHVKRLAEK
jgi:mono/diheme cytochrome c family protein